MDNEDFDFYWEGLECNILRSMAMKALKSAFEPCATNEVTNLGIFGKKNDAFSFSSLLLTLSTIFDKSAHEEQGE
ncbi:unnamed protein product [Bathycoccus prasinos]